MSWCEQLDSQQETKGFFDLHSLFHVARAKSLLQKQNIIERNGEERVQKQNCSLLKS